MKREEMIRKVHENQAKKIIAAAKGARSVHVKHSQRAVEGYSARASGG